MEIPNIIYHYLVDAVTPCCAELNQCNNAKAMENISAIKLNNMCTAVTMIVHCRQIPTV